MEESLADCGISMKLLSKQFRDGVGSFEALHASNGFNLEAFMHGGQHSPVYRQTRQLDQSVTGFMQAFLVHIPAVCCSLPASLQLADLGQKITSALLSQLQADAHLVGRCQIVLQDDVVQKQDIVPHAAGALVCFSFFMLVDRWKTLCSIGFDPVLSSTSCNNVHSKPTSQLMWKR